jgi:hypothetical protein
MVGAPNTQSTSGCRLSYIELKASSITCVWYKGKKVIMIQMSKEFEVRLTNRGMPIVHLIVFFAISFDKYVHNMAFIMGENHTQKSRKRQ